MNNVALYRRRAVKSGWHRRGGERHVFGCMLEESQRGWHWVLTADSALYGQNVGGETWIGANL